jgi:hypothetical protein
MSKARVYTDVNVLRPKEYWDYEALTVQWGSVLSSPPLPSPDPSVALYLYPLESSAPTPPGARNSSSKISVVAALRAY